MATGDEQQEVGTRPVPDPTDLTTDALRREIATLKELVEQRIEGIVAVREEEFRGVRDKLSLVEQQRVEQKSDTKAAVDAALTAQKEAVAEQTTASERSIAKSEAATTKSIEQLGGTFTTALDGMRREIGDLKERVTTVEQQKVGGREIRAQQSVTIGQVIAAISAAVAVLGVLVAVVLSAS